MPKKTRAPAADVELFPKSRAAIAAAMEEVEAEHQKLLAELPQQRAALIRIIEVFPPERFMEFAEAVKPIIRRILQEAGREHLNRKGKK